MLDFSRISLSIYLPETTEEDIADACKKAIKKGLYSVSAPLNWVSSVANYLKGSSIQTAAKISFPLGVDLPEQKFLASLCAIESGASEIDLVCNMGAAKSADFSTLSKEVTPIVNLCHEKGIKVNAYIEYHLLTEGHISETVLFLESTGVDRIGTSAGFKGMKQPKITVQNAERIQSKLMFPEKIKLIGFGDSEDDLASALKTSAEIVEIDQISLVQ